MIMENWGDKNKKIEGYQEEDKVVNNPTNDFTISFNFKNYKYTKEDVEKFFTSENGQEENHNLEECICRELIGQQISKPFFYYCKEDPKLENINLKNIEDHIRLKDPERHKAKLLELVHNKEAITQQQEVEKE